MVLPAADVTLFEEARRTTIGITYDGVDVSNDLSPYLEGLTYADALSGEADDLQIVLQDRDGLFRGDWAPEFGDVVEVYIEAESWVNGGETMRLNLGSCIVDEIGSSGPPATVTLKAISAGMSTGLRRTKRTRAWQEANLEDIAQDIADRAGIGLLFSAPEFGYGATTSTVPTREVVPAFGAEDETAAETVAVSHRVVRYKRVDQKHESDLAFLLRLCTDAGLNLKVTNSTIVIFLEADLEAGESVATLAPYVSNVTGWSSFRSSTDLYRSCVIRYRDPVAGILVEAVVGATRSEGGKTIGEDPSLVLTRRVDDQAEAERLAEQFLVNANQATTMASIECDGDPAIVAGVVVTLDGIYGAAGRYIATQVTHSPTGGYTCSLTLRRILGG